MTPTDFLARIAEDEAVARAERDAEVEDLREQVENLEAQLDADRKHAALAEGETCDVCTHLESEQVQAWMAQDDAELKEIDIARREVADLRAGVQEVIDARGRGDFSPLLPKLRALLANTDAAKESK